MLYAAETRGGVEFKFQSFLISALGGGVVSLTLTPIS